ncbi:dioxygenase ferredoxin reductase component [gamma proteobacterium HTCC5015]|nr:dioxygenase ferredoxin reductase component [gamma proteobacterium HTCC5015]
MSYHTICKTEELPVGEMKKVNVEGRKIAIYHLKDGIYATQSSCTHVMANLTKGKIVDDCKVQCPLHRAQFDIKTGEVVTWANFPPGIQALNFIRGEKSLKTYPVIVEDELIKVDV